MLLSHPVKDGSGHFYGVFLVVKPNEHSSRFFSDADLKAFVSVVFANAVSVCGDCAVVANVEFHGGILSDCRSVAIHPLL